MPSTARVNIAQRDSLNIITESLDHVWNTQYGRHMQSSLPAATAVTVTWPTTGETMLYLVVTVPGGTGGDLTLKATGATDGFVVVIPPANIKVPFLLQKQKTATGFSLTCTVAAEASMVFI